MQISRKHIHIFGEIAALIFIVPYLLSLLYRYTFIWYDFYIIIFIIITTIVIDGYLLYKFATD